MRMGLLFLCAYSVLNPRRPIRITRIHDLSCGKEQFTKERPPPHGVASLQWEQIHFCVTLTVVMFVFFNRYVS